ncbi:hypothetical protein [Flavobacterium hercynium]|uniref:Signal peptidase n=1 Tax=Flavobacterium hercynium TaxID=387094 RepID=A0A226HFP1_9FLAO|nr:hypothetical protein [Flavobacterium hercynium]OXA93159.1 hypothetical protein B0A66_07745 [Flavobacterium hercynium]SMP32791.1 hypothetical protein SAMN06265346_11596 [Flavobacterium hercynium]
MKIKSLQLSTLLFFYASFKISAAPPPPPPGIPPPVGLPIDSDIPMLLTSAILLGLFAISRKRKINFYKLFFNKRIKSRQSQTTTPEAVQLIKVKL